MKSQENKNVESLQKSFLSQIDFHSGFQILFDQINSVYFFIKDLNGTLIFTNRQLLHHYGFKNSDELIGKTDFDFLPHSLAEKYRWDDLNVAETRKPLIRQMELFLDDLGIPDWYYTTKLPLFSVEGTVIGIMGIVQKFYTGQKIFTENIELAGIIRYLREHSLENIQPGELVRISGLSPRKIQRLFKEKLNTTPRDLLMKTRILKACDKLRLTRQPLIQIAMDCGFYDQSSFTRNFKKHIGITPRLYRSEY